MTPRNKTRKVKEIVGTVLSDKGFKYIRREKGIIWTFARKVGDVEQEVYIQQHTPFDEEYKLMLWTSAKGNGMKEIGSVLPEYKEQEYWQARSDEEFIQVMEFFASFIQEHGFDLLEDMLEEKPDSFETPERKKYFKEHREELIEKYDNLYHILDNGEPEEQLKHIDEVLWDNRIAEETSEKMGEINDLWLGMAAILTEIVIRFQGSGTINCNTYRVTLSLNDSLFDIEPIDIVVQSWLQYHCDNDKSMLMVWAQARTVVMYKV